MNDKEEGSGDNSGDLNDELDSARQGYFEFHQRRSQNSDDSIIETEENRNFFLEQAEEVPQNNRREPMPETSLQEDLENNSEQESEQEQPELQDQPQLTPIKVNNFTDFVSEVKVPTESNKETPLYLDIEDTVRVVNNNQVVRGQNWQSAKQRKRDKADRQKQRQVYHTSSDVNKLELDADPDKQELLNQVHQLKQSQLRRTQKQSLQFQRLHKIQDTSVQDASHHKGAVSMDQSQTKNKDCAAFSVYQNSPFLELPQKAQDSNHVKDLSISTIPSDQNTQKPHMDSAIQAQSSIEYDERDFVMSTQEGQTRKNVPQMEAGQSPRVNLIRGLTPQKRLLTSQKKGGGQDDSLAACQAISVGRKDQFQNDINLIRVEPKRSVSQSAKKSAAELQRPYNRRAQILKERKDALKMQARESSFQRSQKKTDSISRLYSRPAEGTKGIFKGDSASMSHQLLDTSSMSISNAQGTQMYTGAPIRSGQLGGSMLNFDAFDHSSGFPLNEQFASMSHHPTQLRQSVATNQHEHMVIIKHAQKIQPGNQQVMSQSVSQSGYRPIQTDDSASGIERAKQFFNEKVQRMADMADWGPFASSFARQRPDPENTVRTVGADTKRAINQKESVQRVQVANLAQQDAFALAQLGVFTPPAAMKNFQLAQEDAGRVVPFTMRDAEGEIPHPKKSQLRPTPQRSQNASIGGGMTLNPNNQHGVAVGSALPPNGRVDASQAAKRRIAGGTSAKSTKSLRELLSGSRRTDNNSRSVNRPGHRPHLGMDSMRQTVADHNRNHATKVMHTSMSQVVSPQFLAGGVQLAPDSQSVQPILHAAGGIDMQSEYSKQQQQEEYPCSAFFQNDENFEKPSGAHLSHREAPKQDSFFQQDGYSPYLPKRLNQSGTISGLGEVFVTQFHPANSQGEEPGLVTQPAMYTNMATSPCQSPAGLDLNSRVVQRAKQLYHAASANDMNPSNSGGVKNPHLSRTARKNLSHQKRTPGGRQGKMSHAGGGHYINNQPSFLVVGEQQKRDASLGHCSIADSIQLAEEDDLPPDPMFQTKTLDSDRHGQHREEKPAPPTNDDLQEERNEIIAVAPKRSMLGRSKEPTAMQTHPDTQTEKSVLITTSDVEFLQKGARDKRTRQANHKPIPQAIQSAMSTLEKSNEESKKQKEYLEVAKVEDSNFDSSVNTKTEEEKPVKKRENSFVRDGYEIYLEGTYIVNGRMKKKIKKRKLSKQQLDRHNKALEAKVREEKAAGRNAFRLERELQAITDIGRQTQQMPAGQKVVTLKAGQVQMKAPSQGISLSNLQRQTGSQASILGDAAQNSPRLKANPYVQLKNPKNLNTKQSLQTSSAGALRDMNSTSLQPEEQKAQVVPGPAKQVTKIRVMPGKNPQTQQVKIPRTLFKKRASPQNSDSAFGEESKVRIAVPAKSPYLAEEESKTPFGQSASQKRLLSNRSPNFRDPDLQLVTSSRQMTLRDVSQQLLGGCQRFILHRMIFQKKFPELLKVFRSGFLQATHLDEVDHAGNTPLLLAAKLSANEEEYLKCINFLFKEGCNGKIRDANGWSVLDEAIMQGNSRLLAIAFNWLNIHKKEKIQRNKVRVLERLKNVPDFYCELHWECQSNWIPFLSKLAPSDDFQIWKVGSNIRLDFSLVGFKKLKNKRRRMSILFRNAAEDEEDERYQSIDIIMVNHDRKILSNPLEDLDDDEKLAVLTDIMNADPVQNELNIKRQDWQQQQNFFGNGYAQESVNGYACSRFKLNIQAQVRSKKKLSQRFEHTYESYFEGAEEFREERKVDADPESFKMAKDVEKTVESQLWLSQQYPLQFGQFMEVLDTLAISGQASMQKIHEFLQNECLQDVASRNGFPVKIQVPIGMIVKAMVTFGHFEFLDPPDRDDYIRDTFQIPADCQLVSRKEGMKTMQSRKKRLAVANVVI